MTRKSLGYYCVILHSKINPRRQTYHWFIIKNLFKDLDFYIYDFSDNNPEFLNIIREYTKDKLFVKTFNLPEDSHDSTNRFDGFWRYEGRKEATGYPQKQLKTYFETYFELNNIKIKEI